MELYLHLTYQLENRTKESMKISREKFHLPSPAGAPSVSNSSSEQIFSVLANISVTRKTLSAMNLFENKIRQCTFFTNEWQTPSKHIHEIR